MPQTVNTHLVASAGAQLRGFGYTTYATPSALPVNGQPGEIVYVAAMGRLYMFDAAESRWVIWGGGSSSWLSPARALSTSNVNISSPGATIDGVAMTAGDRFVLAGQTVAAENGVWVWNGAASAATRASDLNSGSEATGATLLITEGTNADRQYMQTADNVTIGTTAQTWVMVGPATSVAAASETVAGLVELATNAETIAGIDGTRAVTPASLTALLNNRGGTALIGDGAATTGTVPHGVTGLAPTDDLVIRATIEATGQPAALGVSNDTTNITWDAVAAPAANAYRLTWFYGGA